MMRLHMTPGEIVAFVREAAVPGERVKIAAQMNLCKPSVIRDICEQYGLHITATKSRPGRKGWPTAKVEQLRRMVDAGKTVTEIAAEFEIDTASIYYHLRKNEIPYPKKKRLRDGGNHPGAAEMKSAMLKHHI